MAEKADEKNRRADNVNPLRSGIRTGNPQLNAREGSDDKPTKAGHQRGGKAGQTPGARKVPGDQPT